MNALLMSKVGMGIFVFLLGLLVVFFGMLVIVTVISIIGKIMKSNAAKKEKTVVAKSEPAPVHDNAEGCSCEDETLKAAIIAAVMAYFTTEGNGCEFRIKRIKRIN